ncbi:MAG: hypothetical protein AAFR61_14370 [Bacteroidota bacterium]
MKRYLSIWLIGFFFLGSTATYLQAQDQPAIHKLKGTFGKMQVGANFLDLETINQVLTSTSNGFQALPENFFAVGLGFWKIRKRAIYGVDIYNYMTVRSELNNQDAILGYHYGLFKVGLLAHRFPGGWHLYPTVGAGGGLSQLNLRPNTDPTGTRNYSGGWLFDACLNGSYIVPMVDDSGNQLEFTVALGYMYAPADTWRLKGLVGPETGNPAPPRGLYFRLGLGMGKWR